MVVYLELEIRSIHSSFSKEKDVTWKPKMYTRR